MENKKHLKEAIEAIDYSIAILQWQRQNLINKSDKVHTNGDTTPKPPCPAGYYEENGKCILDVG